MKPVLQTVPATTEPGGLCELLQRDGGGIVTDVLSQTQLERINADLDQIVADTAPGIRHPSKASSVEFFGTRTIRFDGMPAKSSVFVEAMQLPFLTGVADQLLLPNCVDYLLNTGQLIQIGPGETAQALHRDEDAWGNHFSPKPLLQVEALFALSDFSAKNGATQVVPGSHRWESDRKPEPSEVCQAEMKAGSALLYLGSTIHGGGANLTEDQSRRGLFLGYVVGWLRTEENMFLTVPIEKVRELPERCQELLGYKSHGGIGVVDVGNPMSLVR